MGLGLGVGFEQVLLLKKSEADARVGRRDIGRKGAARARKEGDAMRRDAPLPQLRGVKAP